jgi:hypothetical protein
MNESYQLSAVSYQLVGLRGSFRSRSVLCGLKAKNRELKTEA